MKKRQDAFIKQFVIGLGFLSGLWLYFGFNPSTKIIEFIVSIAKENGYNLAIFYFLPSIIFIFSVIFAYYRGGILGLIAVTLAFISGILLLVVPVLGGVLFILSILIGMKAATN